MEKPRYGARLRARLEPLRPLALTARLWFWAALVGAFSAGAVVAFRWAMQQIELIATGQTGGLVQVARSLSPWSRVLVCAIGAIVAGLVLQVGLRWANGGPQGSVHVDYIDAARLGRSDLNPRTTWARTLSSLVSVGTGASIGREGPMIQLAAWLASVSGRVVSANADQRNALLVCGIAAGIGAAYHAPVAGVVFVLELALGFFSRYTIVPVLIAVSTSSALIYWLVEPHPLYSMVMVPFAPANVGVALVAGLVLGALGWALLGLLDFSRRCFSKVASLPLRFGIGGVMVGGLSALAPEVWGNGYSVVSQTLQDGGTWPALAFILLMKIVSTALSSGSGAIGGVFTPSLFVGAVSGSALAQLAAVWLPVSIVGDPRGLAVVGMAAVLTAVTHAPLMSIVMVLEMTNQFQLAVPVMLACGAAYAVSTEFGAHPLYGNPIEGHR